MSEADDTMREVEEKLEILRARARAYEEFVSPPGQPPLLWQMAMLADAGFTVLPAVNDLDLERCFPELTVAMTGVEWSDEHHCLVGGEGFSVMRVPPSYHGDLLRPRALRLAFYASSMELPMPVSYEVEHFRRLDFAISFAGRVRWRSRIMICVGSRADARARQASARARRPVPKRGEKK